MAKRQGQWRQMGIIALIAVGFGAVDAWGRRGSERCESCISPYLPPAEVARGNDESLVGEQVAKFGVGREMRPNEGELSMP